MNSSNRTTLFTGIIVGLIIGLLLGMVLFWGSSCAVDRRPLV